MNPVITLLGNPVFRASEVINSRGELPQAPRFSLSLRPLPYDVKINYFMVEEGMTTEVSNHVQGLFLPKFKRKLAKRRGES